MTVKDNENRINRLEQWKDETTQILIRVDEKTTNILKGIDKLNGTVKQNADRITAIEKENIKQDDKIDHIPDSIMSWIWEHKVLIGMIALIGIGGFVGGLYAFYQVIQVVK